jgi:nicotinate-nucleotide--dimethylbenzimidazole phosphoribosyltransferase
VTERKGVVVEAIRRIQPTDTAWRVRAKERLDTLTKPSGSLGRLEEIAARLCAIQETLSPTSSKRRVVVCAADHGVAAERVSAYPADVTAQMVANFVNGGAAINVLAKTADADVWVIDVGVAGPVEVRGTQIPFVSRPVREGTANMTQGPAMSEQEMLCAIMIGLEQADLAADDGVALLALGEMGIANTTAASAITSALTGVEPARVTGRGTGIDDQTLARKTHVIEQALALHSLRADAPFEILQTVGGLEIAALAGLCLGAARQRQAIVTDGFISTAAAMLAVCMCPSVADYLFAAHLSPEPGHAVQLDWLHQRPFLHLDMRLGEGTGAALALNIMGAACAAFTDMATFESAGVNGRR